MEECRALEPIISVSRLFGRPGCEHPTEAIDRNDKRNHLLPQSERDHPRRLYECDQKRQESRRAPVSSSSDERTIAFVPFASSRDVWTLNGMCFSGAHSDPSPPVWIGGGVMGGA